MRRELEEKLCIKAYDLYGLTEIIGPGVGHECECQQGTHLCEDHFYPEIVDPETGAPLPAGEIGELVFSTISKEGMPLLRFRTRDLSSLNLEPCACGRTSLRMSRILGRCDDMLIIRGINIFPSQVESVICEMPQLEPHYLLIVDRVNNLDSIEVQVEVKEDFYSDEVNKMLGLRKQIVHRLQSMLTISPDVRLVEPRTIERSQGKAKRVIDKRNFK
jgi:phenylacetate-CoA ligase